METNKTILITGAAGFIGSHLSEYYLNRGYNVIGVDNLITGSRQNLLTLLKSEKFKFIEQDVSKEMILRDKIDYILHFASPASPIDYLKIPIRTIEVNTLGTMNMMKLALYKNARILVASTSEIYGDPVMHPQSESYNGNVNPLGPRSVYDESKRMLETITQTFNTQYGVDTRIIRIFNTFGPRMRINDGRILPTFIGQILNNENITVFGDGSQTRSFCFIEDLVLGIDAVLHSNYKEPFNLGNTEEISVLEFANELKALTNSSSKIIFKELPKDDPKVRKPDIQRAKDLLKWQPEFKRIDGLKKTIEWYKETYPQGIKIELKPRFS